MLKTLAHRTNNTQMMLIFFFLVFKEDLRNTNRENVGQKGRNTWTTTPQPIADRCLNGECFGNDKLPLPDICMFAANRKKHHSHWHAFSVIFRFIFLFFSSSRCSERVPFEYCAFYTEFSKTIVLLALNTTKHTFILNEIQLCFSFFSRLVTATYACTSWYTMKAENE